MELTCVDRFWGNFVLLLPRKNIYFRLLTTPKPLTVDHSKLWKILKRDGSTRAPDLPLRNLYAGQEATVRTGHGTTDWF